MGAELLFSGQNYFQVGKMPPKMAPKIPACTDNKLNTLPHIKNIFTTMPYHEF